MPINTIIANIIDNLPVHPDIDAFRNLVKMLSFKTNIGLINKAKLFFISSKIYRAIKESNKEDELVSKFGKIPELFGKSIFNPFSEGLINIIEENQDRSLINGFLLEGLFNYRPMDESIHLIRELLVLDKIPYHTINIIFERLPEHLLYSFLFSDNFLIKQIALKILERNGWIPKTLDELFQVAEIKGDFAILFYHGSEVKEFIYQLYRDQEDPTTRIAIIRKLVQLDFKSPDFIEDLGQLLMDYPHGYRHIQSYESKNKNAKSGEEQGESGQNQNETAFKIIEDKIWSEDWQNEIDTGYPLYDPSKANQVEFCENNEFHSKNIINDSKTGEFLRAIKNRRFGMYNQKYKGINPQLRKTAAWALGKLGNTQAIMLLRMALKDPEPEVRKAAKNAIKSIKSRIFNHSISY